MERAEIHKLLGLEESETLERKQSLEKEGICKSIVAFANDMHGHEKGWLICGQAPVKTLAGLREPEDEIQRIVSDLARNNCSPAVPVSVRCLRKTRNDWQS